MYSAVCEEGTQLVRSSRSKYGIVINLAMRAWASYRVSVYFNFLFHKVRQSRSGMGNM